MRFRPRIVAIIVFAGTAVLASAAHAGAAGVLCNGIVLPDPWPHRLQRLPQDPVTPYYLSKPPSVIPIDVGRQLFVDDFLIEQSSLRRAFHTPTVYGNPAHQPMSYSGGVWYDPSQKLCKRWCNDKGLKLQVSEDGLTWQDPVKTNVPAALVLTGRGTRWAARPISLPARRTRLAGRPGDDRTAA